MDSFQTLQGQPIQEALWIQGKTWELSCAAPVSTRSKGKIACKDPLLAPKWILYSGGYSIHAIKLSNWVFNQRSEYSRKQRGMKNSLTKEREAKLDSLNFRWAIMGKKKADSSPTQPIADASRIASLPNRSQPAPYHPPTIRHQSYSILLPHYQSQQRMISMSDHILRQEQIIISKLLQLRG